MPLETRDRSIQLLTFKLDDQEYAVEIANVVQVVQMVAVTRLPQGTDAVEGIINLHGEVTPVIDTRKRLGLAPKPHDPDTQLLITRVKGRTLALTVDAVSQVLALASDRIEPSQRIGAEPKYLSAVGNMGDRLILILDPLAFLADAPKPEREN